MVSGIRITIILCVISLVLSGSWVGVSLAADEIAYVANDLDGTVSVLDMNTFTVIKTVPDVLAAQKIFLAPNLLNAYVQASGTYGQRLRIIETTNHTVWFTGFGGRTQTMDFQPDSSLIYVGTHNPYQAYIGGQCMYGGGLQVYEGGTHSFLRCFDFGEQGPSVLSVRTDGGYVYANGYSSRKCSVEAIDRGLTMRTSIPLNINVSAYSYQFVRGMAQTPDGRFLFVSGGSHVSNSWCEFCDQYNYGHLHKIDTATNQVAGYLVVPRCEFGEIVVTPDAAYACIIDWFYKVLYIVNTDTFSYRTVPLVETSKKMIPTPDSRYLYLIKPFSNVVEVVDIANAAVVALINVGSSPYDMAMTPDGRFILVTNRNSNTVSLIDTATNAVSRTIPVGRGPQAIAVIPSRNKPPTAEAGPNLDLQSDMASGTTIHGTATDPDGDPLQYRWLDGENELQGWQPVGPGGEADLSLLSVPPLSVGTHAFTLEVTDGKAATRDAMTVSLANSAPNIVATGAGTYQIHSPVPLGGEVSDYDGDILTYEWLVDDVMVFRGSIQGLYGATPLALTPFILSDPDLGLHTITLRVSDGTNPPVDSSITVEVVDTVAPTIAPVASTTLLWPPDHTMRDIRIDANAADNSGGAVTLNVIVSSSEAENGLGDGDTAPDWTEPLIDNANGIIRLQLRAERYGGGGSRTYTVLIGAVDSSGNSSQAMVSIIVPHDKRFK